MKLFIIYNIEKKEMEWFPWAEKGEPPPLIKPQIKKRKSNHQSNDEEKEKPS